jgi:Uma2 family endonuclease
VYHRFGVPHYWIIDPAEETLSVLRWIQDGYVEILTAERSETVRAEPFEAMPPQVGIFFGDDEKDEEPAQEG